MSEGYSVTRGKTSRLEVEIAEPFIDDGFGFEAWVDRIWAVWRPRVGPPTATGGYWEMSGENCGPGNGMIIHAYQIDPLIELLRSMKVVAANDHAE